MGLFQFVQLESEPSLMNRFSRISLAPVWGALASILLSLGWLLPNHSEPWTSFHSDAWVATMLAVVGVVVIVRARQPVVWHGLALVIAILLPLPFVQYAYELLPFAGQAWAAGAYTVGFLMAFVVGQQWQGWRPLWLGDILFSAIGIAAVISIALQLQQWLGPSSDGTLDIWVRASDGARPSANMAQPNQLATLLLWGLIACGWGVWRRQVGRGPALLTSAFILVGLALTQSRTGAFGLLALVLATWIWRRVWRASSIPWYVTGLAGFYALLLMALTPVRRLLMLDVPGSMVARLDHELRPELWRMLLDAVWQHPWAGFGWNQVVPAQVAVADHYLALHHPFFQSHNLFLDFMLWAGIPLGILLTACVLIWLSTAASRVRHPQDALYLLFVLVVGIHAMLELPLHYAYFLLPTGLVVGALNAELRIWPLGRSSWIAGRWILLGVWCLGAILLALIVRDYFRVEATYAALQLEKAQLLNSSPAEVPEVLLLTDLREIQRFMKFEPAAGASSTELQWAREVTLIWPSSRNFMTLAILLGLNGQPVEAQQWLAKMCHIVPRDQCGTAPSRWAQAQKLHPQLAVIEWPATMESTQALVR